MTKSSNVQLLFIKHLMALIISTTEQNIQRYTSCMNNFTMCHREIIAYIKGCSTFYKSDSLSDNKFYDALFWILRVIIVCRTSYLS